MERYPFIFSNEWKYRFRRHFFFWGSWWVFMCFLYSFSALAFRVSYFKRVPLSAIESLFYMVPHMFLGYTLMYWVIPRMLLKGKYVLTLVSVIMLFLATALISSIIGIYVIHEVRSMLLGKLYIPPAHYYEINLFGSLLAGLRGAITVGGVAASIKLMKYWYVKEQRNLQLQKENVNAELQLLKAQIHPHFLFNTLNNIYSHTQNTSVVASRLVMGLSDLLRYMLYECKEPLVPLTKELKMLQDYIVLEQIRYNKELDISIEIPSDTDGLLIAPLLLLPFVENCFKHGTSQLLEDPWISLNIVIEDDDLKMKLVNGKSSGYVPKKSAGIGIANVKKRLELLYPEKHNLRITDDPEVFIVTLKVKLEREKLVREVKTIQLVESE